MCNKEFFKLFRIRFEKKILKYEKSEKNNIWKFDLDEENGSIFFHKITARVTGGHFFLSTTKLSKNNSSLNRGIRFEKQVSEIRKKWATNVWNLDLG